MKSKVDYDVNKMFWVAMVLSVLFVVGIPLTIVAATKGMTLPMVLGIIFIVVGFYGMPMAWVSYGGVKSLKRVVDAVMEEHLTTNKEVAQQLQVTEEEAKQNITKAINKKYITGYIYDGAVLTPNEKKAPKKKVVVASNICARCGAPMDLSEHNMKCPYCGTKYETQ